MTYIPVYSNSKSVNSNFHVVNESFTPVYSTNSQNESDKNSISDKINSIKSFSYMQK